MKKLIALAVAGAFIAPAAFADSKNVEIYGIATAGIEKTNDSYRGTGQTAVSDFGSRIGFKGSEDLGAGLKALFTIESKVALDVGGTSLATREAHVGVAGNFGAVLAGRGKTPLQTSLDVFDPFYGNDTLAVGEASATTLAGVLLNDSVGDVLVEGRANNWVAYASPNIQGLNVVAAYVFGENKPATAGGAADKAISLKATYDVAGAQIVGSYQQVTAGKGAHTNTGTDEAKATDMLIGATYGMGPVNLGAAMLNSKVEQGNTELKRTSLTANATYGMGNITLMGGVLMAGKLKGTNTYTNGNYADDDTKFTRIVVGADYNLSKRTVAFAEYAKTNVKKVAADLTTPTAPATELKDPSTLTIGLNHAF